LPGFGIELKIAVLGTFYCNSAVTTVRLHRRGQRGACHPKFVAYAVILSFQKRRLKQKYRYSPKVTHFGPPKILVWLRHCSPITTLFVYSHAVTFVAEQLHCSLHVKELKVIITELERQA